jgi:hypothetical protein
VRCAWRGSRAAWLAAAVPVLWLVPLPMAQFHWIGERDRVALYERPQAAGLEVLAIGEIGAPPAEVMSLLLDYERQPHFVKGLKESRILSRFGDGLFVYQRLQPPWIAERDFTLSVRTGRSGENLWIRFQVANDRGPAPRPGVHRLSMHQGTWVLYPVRGGQATRAQYHFRIDLGSGLPGWMTRTGATKAVAGLFQAVRRQLGRSVARTADRGV